MKAVNFITKADINSIIGRQNKKAGELFENMIMGACEFYRVHGIAYIEKTPEPFRVLGRMEENGRVVFRGVFCKRSQPDFKGTLCGGLAVCFEAKHTERDRIEQRAVTNEQGDCLEMHNSLGAKAFVVVSLLMRDFYRVPWEFWRDMSNVLGHKYMNRQDLERFRIPFDGNVKFLEGMDD